MGHNTENFQSKMQFDWWLLWYLTATVGQPRPIRPKISETFKKNAEDWPTGRSI